MILRWYFSLHFQRSLIRDKVLCIKDISLIIRRKMRLWDFFREKRFIRACICWFFIACVLPSKIPPFCWNYHVPQIALLFTIVSPHITFFETFLLKVLLFRLYFLLLRCHILTGSSNWAKVGWTYIHKRRNCTLWFWRY